MNHATRLLAYAALAAALTLGFVVTTNAQDRAGATVPAREVAARVSKLLLAETGA